MKFTATFCPQQSSSPTVEEFLLSNNEISDNHVKTETNDCISSATKEDSRWLSKSKPRNTEKQHISRRWCYLSGEDNNISDNRYHRVIFEAPFMKMKEIHIDPPRYPIREDSRKLRSAESKKEEGNKLYKQNNYTDALSCYSSAIELCPNKSSYYGNRSACYMMLNRYKLALEDAQKSVKLDPTYVKGYLREAKCHIIFGDICSAIRSLDNAKKYSPDDTSIETSNELKSVATLKKYVENANKYYAKADYRAALYSIGKAIEIANECVNYKILKAEYLALLSRNKESQDIVNDILRTDEMNVDAIFVRGLSLYYEDNIEKACQHFQRVIVLSPDHSRAKDVYKKAKQLKATKDKGNDEYNNNKLEDALNTYTSALQIDQSNRITNAKLHFNRALVYAKRNKLNEAIDDCSNAIKLDPNYIKAYLKRAKLYMDLEMFEQCIKDYEFVWKKEKTKEHKQLLDNAKLALRRSKRRDHYKVLGVPRNASAEQIKKAYRSRAMTHHPDRHTNATESERKEHEKKFKDVGEAYAVLSDPKRRSRYDNGIDAEKGSNNFDPNDIFHAFTSAHSNNFFHGTFHYDFHRGATHNQRFTFNNFAS